MKKLIEEFKAFALRGNVIDLAVGVIIGAAFQNIVTSLTDDIISPLIGLVAKTDFKDLALSVFGVNIKYGSFITAVINFLIMAIVLFTLIKIMNKAASLGSCPEEPAAPATKTCPFCKSEIAIEATRCPHCTSQLEEAAE
ncbi:large conductance mechanosensitive channel protein MscL [Butyricicoccus sp.]|uniref:large conductance mechanosensitive channel protein MscL n=1 Tax=Butyricicoccus sp. TaxID=2049021 RepID=UPI003F16008D